MEEYYLNNVIIKGHAFILDDPLGLNDVIELAKELASKGYIYNIQEKIAERHYRFVSLNQLEERLKKSKKIV